MKKLCSVFAGLFLLLFTLSLNAQTKPAEDYFVAKWDMLFEGLPQGDPRMIISLQRKDGKLEGSIMDSAQKEIAKISKVDEKDKSITVYFTAQGYDVTLDMTKKDEDNITGSLMGMFEAKGVRMKEEARPKQIQPLITSNNHDIYRLQKIQTNGLNPENKN